MAATTDRTSARTGPWRLVRRGLVVLIFAYLGFMLVLLALENWFIYRPVTAAQSWVEPTDPAIRDVYFDTPTGDRIHGWWRPRPGANRAMIYCHGNAGNLSHRGGGLARWADTLDSSVLIFDYPGYGRSTGSPSEASLYAAGEAAWTWVTTDQGIAPENIILVGASLGGTVATELAVHRTCRALVLIKAFMSVPDMAQARYPWVPARYFVRHRFDNISKLPQIHRPVFVVHGTADRVVPFSQGERLFAAANDPKEFFPILDNDHNDKLPDEMFDRLRQFIDAHP
jgi:fermentation-respiration switch protein FrsA (DUF1100 family)